jgi:translocator protein
MKTVTRIALFLAMTLRTLQISSLLAATYVAVVVGGIFVHFADTGDYYTLRYSLTLPGTLLVALVGSAIAIGLWRGRAWAWWLGLTAVAVQLFRFTPWLLKRLMNGNVPAGSWFIACLLLAFGVTLLTPAVRRSCCR